MRDRRVHTKIVATLGPATASEEALHTILGEGVDVCRLNFSHGDHASHERNLMCVRAWGEAARAPVAVLGDLCGPKIRLTMVENDRFELEAGAQVHFRRGAETTRPGEFRTTYENFVDEVRVGQRVYIDDGLLRLLVTEKTDDALVCTCTVGGTISSRKGINLPDTALRTPALTDKDLIDLAWAIEHELDFVALSFVRTAEDLERLRAEIDKRQSPLKIIVKIEKFEALEHLDRLVELADGVMVARGDLGVEMDVWQVPLVQKAITRRCRELGKPVIIATQMLQSMVNAPTPTRAEVSDVANAILDGVDAVMLSAETAAGKYPAAAVDIMARTVEAAEAYCARTRLSALDAPAPIADVRTSAIARGAVQAALYIDAKLIAVWTSSGETVRLVARERPPMPILGLTWDERVFRQLNLLYGVIPIRVPPIREPTKLVGELEQELFEAGLAEPGEMIVVVHSTTPTISGCTDTTLVHRMGQRSPGP